MKNKLILATAYIVLFVLSMIVFGISRTILSSDVKELRVEKMELELQIQNIETLIKKREVHLKNRREQERDIDKQWQALVFEQELDDIACRILFLRLLKETGIEPGSILTLNIRKRPGASPNKSQVVVMALSFTAEMDFNRVFRLIQNAQREKPAMLIDGFSIERIRESPMNQLRMTLLFFSNHVIEDHTGAEK